MNEIEPRPEKISPTAGLTAYLRTFSDIPYSQEIAQIIRSRETFYEIGGESMIPLAPIIEARFKGINQIVESLGIKNILEIACGISPRGLVMTKDPSVTYMETDLPAVLHQKQALVSRLLADLGETRANLHFCEANVLEVEQLLSASETLSGRIVVVSEGLFQYLKRGQKIVVAKNIKQVLIAKGGVWVTPDFLTQASQNEMLKGPKIKDDLRRLSGSTGADMEINAFTDARDISDFFEEVGFGAEEFDFSSMLEKLSSIDRSGANLKQVRTILETRKIRILRPDNSD